MSDPIQHAPDDPALLAAVRAGSTEALGQLYVRHAEMVYRTAYRLLGSRDNAADVLQDVFLGLPRALERYREQGRFPSWLRSVATRTALLRMRTERRRREDRPGEEVEATAGTAPKPVVERIELQRALGAMPTSLRTVFVLKEVEGYTHEEIAELLEITSAASATRLVRAWRFLRRRFRIA